jgi:formylglycine-generating enzyme required for sulfatase activity
MRPGCWRSILGWRSCGSLAFAAVVVALLGTVPAAGQISLDMVMVGDLDNPGDGIGGPGSVGYLYKIQRNEFTSGEFAAFLDSVGATNPQNIASNFASMGITRSGSPGAYSYTVNAGSENLPVPWANWYTMARVANWLHHGQSSDPALLETGAYRMSSGSVISASRTADVNTYTTSVATALQVGDQVTISGLGGTGFNITGIVATKPSDTQFTVARVAADETATGSGSLQGASATRLAGAKFWIPSENEWYKAAYYDPTLNSGTGGYTQYATRSNTAPTTVTYSGTTGLADGFGNTANVTPNPLALYVGTSGTSSYYGTYDMVGNLWEFTETILGDGSARQQRGSSYENGATLGRSGVDSFSASPSGAYNTWGFRIAAVPEPGTVVLAVSGCAVVLAGRCLRKRRR